MREITPKELQELNDKSFKETQKIFRRRLREIAKSGNVHAEYKPKDYKCGEQIKPWLENLGFSCREIGPSWVKVTWPDNTKLMTIEFMTAPKPAKVYPIRIRYNWEALFGTGTFKCSACENLVNKPTKYCPACGNEMIMN